MIAREQRMPHGVRRAILAVAVIALAFMILAPLTSTDAAQSAGLPLLADKLWFRIATTVAMFVVLASAWNIIGGLTGYASFGNVAFFGLGAYTVGVLVTSRNWPFALALLAAPADNVRGQSRDRLAQPPDVSSLGQQEAVEDIEERGLAGAVRADDAEDLARAHVEAHIGQRLEAEERLGDPAHVHERRARHRRRRGGGGGRSGDGGNGPGGRSGARGQGE